MYCKVKIKYKFKQPECARPRALRSRYVLNFQIGCDAYNCRYSTRRTNTFDFSGVYVCRHHVDQIQHGIEHCFPGNNQCARPRALK